MLTPVSSVRLIVTDRTARMPPVAENVTASIACSYCAFVATPDNVNVLLAASQLAVIGFPFGAT